MAYIVGTRKGELPDQPLFEFICKKNVYPLRQTMGNYVFTCNAIFRYQKHEIKVIEDNKGLHCPSCNSFISQNELESNSAKIEIK